MNDHQKKFAVFSACRGKITSSPIFCRGGEQIASPHYPRPFSLLPRPFSLRGPRGDFHRVVAFFLATLFDWSRNVEVPQLIGRDVTLRGQSEICVMKKGNKFTENHRNLLLFFLAAHSDWLPPSPRPF